MKFLSFFRRKQPPPNPIEWPVWENCYLSPLIPDNFTIRHHENKVAVFLDTLYVVGDVKNFNKKNIPRILATLINFYHEHKSDHKPAS